MFVRKFMAVILGLGLTCGGASLVYAGSGNEPVCLSEARDYYSQMCEKPDFRNYCLMRMYGTDTFVLFEKEKEMRENPNKSLREFMERLSKDSKFREDFLNILKIQNNVKSHGGIAKRSTWPPTWG